MRVVLGCAAAQSEKPWCCLTWCLSDEAENRIEKNIDTTELVWLPKTCATHLVVVSRCRGYQKIMRFDRTVAFLVSTECLVVVHLDKMIHILVALSRQVCVKTMNRELKKSVIGLNLDPQAIHVPIVWSRTTKTRRLRVVLHACSDDISMRLQKQTHSQQRHRLPGETQPTCPCAANMTPKMEDSVIQETVVQRKINVPQARTRTQRNRIFV